LYFCILAAFFLSKAARLFFLRALFASLTPKGAIASGNVISFHSATSPYLETLLLYSGLKLMFNAFKPHLDPNDAAGLNQRAA